MAPSAISDDHVAEDLTSGVNHRSSFMRTYLLNGDLAVTLHNNLFCHGGIDMASFGFVPSREANLYHRRLHPLYLWHAPRLLSNDPPPKPNSPVAPDADVRRYSPPQFPPADGPAYPVPWGPMVDAASAADLPPGIDLKYTASVQDWIRQLHEFKNQSAL